ncbi:hypothetical protein AMS69_18030 [Haloarcula rubripromontorii]|uniref:Uncharacterized protein n=1 Tax=Haloarcula rubripromontorii TaxID=1705562 RepID=A0A0N0BMW5_9EURY|nr:hypothetical protein [Haloarcula rubripromontorii]KOX91620.1 hypothetical protein AMS69_18030 [Haloarcula rubripromontorii]
MDEELPKDPMWELVEELRERMDDPDDVSTGQMGDGSAYIVPAETEGEAEEISEWDVEAADDVEVMQTRVVDTEYGVAFIVEDE